MNGEAYRLENPTFLTENTLVQTENLIQTITPGTATGPILGGNLSLLTAVTGSGYLPDFDGAILFIEDVDEAVYRDRSDDDRTRALGRARQDQWIRVRTLHGLSVPAADSAH